MNPRIIYLLSGKNGISGFTRRELELLLESDIDVTLCFTQYRGEEINGWTSIIFRREYFFISLIRNILKLFHEKILIEAIRSGELPSLMVAIYFYDRTKNSNPNFIHVQMGDHKLSIGYYLRKLLKIPLSTTIHAHELYFQYYDATFERFKDVLATCDKVFTISEFNKSILRDTFKIPTDTINVMYLYPSIISHYAEDAVKFLVVGNWEKKKGFEEIIEAAKLINLENFVIYIAGRNVNPDVDLDLESMIKDNGLESKFILLGKLSPALLEILYRFCDIFLLPSKTDFHDNGNVKEREGIPVAIMEAMFFGMPVITTVHAGIPELISDNLVEEANVAQLKAKMEDAINNLAVWKSGGIKNKDIISSKFSEKNVEKLFNYFQQKAN